MKRKNIKLLSALLALAMLLSAVPLAVQAETEGVFTYEITDGEATITDVDVEVSGSLDIPSTLGGVPVTSIGDWAFEDCTNLTSVTIPNSVTSIGNWVFVDCTNLTSVTIPASVTDIGSYVFYNCTNLIDITVETNNPAYTSEDGVLFNKNKTQLICYPTGKSGAYTIPGNVTSIENNAFCFCDGLTAVTISESVISIGGSAFYKCTSLTSVTIPDSVTSIGEYAFENCTSLTSVTISDSMTSIGRQAFFNTAHYNDSTNWENGVLYIGKHLIKADDDLFDSSSYTIKEGILIIADYAFSRCINLISVTIPDSVTSVGDRAFDGCDNLTDISVDSNNTAYASQDGVLFNKNKTEIICYPAGKSGTYIIPGSVTSIGEYAFYNCTSLTSVTIPDSVTSIGNDAFSQCTSLTSVTIPDNVTSIGEGAFFWCNSLTSVTIPNSVTHIGDYAFKDCTSLTSVTIPDSVTSIGDRAFSGCIDLTSVTIPDSITSIGNDAFGNCTSLTSVTIPDSVTSIGNDAFSQCTSLTSVTIPDSVTSIGGWAFSNTAYYNDSTNWNNGVLYIGKHLIKAKYSEIASSEHAIQEGTLTIAGDAFSYCTSLTSVTIPDSVASIGDYAFEECSSLTDVWYQGSESDKAKIILGSGNENLTSATWHYSKSDSPITSSQYTVNDGQISQITEGTTVEELLAGIDQGATCEVVRDGILLSKDTPIATGMVVQIMDGDTVKGFCTIVVEGDSDGDSAINAKDALLALQHSVELVDLQDAYASAADVDRSGQIDAKDALLVLQYSVELIDSLQVDFLNA